MTTLDPHLSELIAVAEFEDQYSEPTSSDILMIDVFGGECHIIGEKKLNKTTYREQLKEGKCKKNSWIDIQPVFSSWVQRAYGTCYLGFNSFSFRKEKHLKSDGENANDIGAVYGTLIVDTPMVHVSLSKTEPFHEKLIELTKNGMYVTPSSVLLGNGVKDVVIEKCLFFIGSCPKDLKDKLDNLKKIGLIVVELCVDFTTKRVVYNIIGAEGEEVAALKLRLLEVGRAFTYTLQFYMMSAQNARREKLKQKKRNSITELSDWMRSISDFNYEVCIGQELNVPSSLIDIQQSALLCVAANRDRFSSVVTISPLKYIDISKFLISYKQISFMTKYLGSNIDRNRLGTVISELEKASVRTAIGSIMSRNGSHNIGSHVLSALSHNVGTMPDDRVLYQYIQHRMDYIATATTDFPQWMTPTMFVGGLMKNFYTQKHLLDYISRSEGLRAYKFQERNLDDAARMNQHETIRVFLRRFYGADSKMELPPADRRYLTYDLFDREWSIYYFFGEKDKLFRQKFSEKKRTQYEVSESGGTAKFLEYDRRFTPDWKQDVRISIPGGIVGQHAFYTIIENVIRNAAKHGWASDKNLTEKDLEINVDFLEGDEDIVFTIGDNVSDVFGEAKDFWNEFFDSFDSISKWDEFLRKNSIKQAIESFQKRDVKVRTDVAEKPSETEFLAETKADKATIEREKEAWKRILRALDHSESQNRSVKQLVAELRQSFLSLFIKDLAIGEVKLLEEYLRMDKKDVPPDDNLPLIYRIQRAYLESDVGKKWVDDRQRNQLTPNAPSNKEVLGRRLILPLHHNQHRKLAQSFIDSDGKLRKENWGLAEMKISAGYLAQRKIEEIGGLDAKGNDILVPIAMPGVCRNADNPHNCLSCCDRNRMLCYNDSNCPLTARRFHLGYRFRIARPKNILVLLKAKTNLPSEVISFFSSDGIDFAYANVIREGELVRYECHKIEQDGKGEWLISNDLMYSFGYRNVVLPQWPTDEADKSAVGSQFGFRCVAQEEVIFHAKNGVVYRLSEIINGLDEDVKAQIAPKEDNNKTNGAVALRKAVLLAWITKLAEECRGMHGGAVRLVVNVEGNESGSERGLVTRKDLLRTMFVECYHTALISFLKSPPDTLELSDTTCRLINLLALIKVVPNKMIEPQQDYGHSDDKGAKEYIRAQLVAYCNLFKTHLLLSGEFIGALKSMERYDKDADNTGDAIVARKIEDIKKDFEKSIARRLFSGKLDEDECVRRGCEDLIVFLQKTDKSKLDRWFDAFHGASDKYVFPEREDAYGRGRHSFEDNLRAVISACSVPEEEEFNALVESLNSMFLASDVYLRKYEERIATLPEAYKHEEIKEAIQPDGEKKDSIQDIADFLMGKKADEDLTCRVIKYSRHDHAMPMNGIYAEALSGSQSYLNALSRLVVASGEDKTGDRYAAVARLLENAFLRILIIDERVMNFVKERSSSEMIKTFINMGIWVADVENRGIPFTDIAAACDKLYRLDYRGLSEDVKEVASTCLNVPRNTFDVLVIHQGIIDKWWERHDKEEVEKVLRDIRKSIPRVVVTTGRGRPENIPDTEKVLPFSVIESSLFRGYPEKLILVNTIMNLLPYGRGRV